MAVVRSTRWLALAAISLAIFAVTLDVTVLTVALPTLATALGASEAQLQWFVTAYTLALVAGMLPAGLLGDRYGRKALMLGGLAVFAIGSIGCALAPVPEVFIAARVALGLAGASLIVVALSVLTVLFDETERPRAIGIWGAANFIGLPLGPILGGWMLTNLWWGWIFLMNVPVALLGFVAVAKLVPESRSPNPPGLDLLGIVLSSGGLIGLEYGIVEGGDHGWATTDAIVPAIVGLVLLAAFVAWERWVRDPLVDLRLFASRSFTWGVICTAIGVFGLFGVLFLLPQYFQAIGGLDPQGSGVRLLPAVVGLVIGAISADRVASKIGAKLTVAIGFAVVASGTLIGSTLTLDSGDAFITAWTFVIGAGGGLGFATSASAALTELEADRAGVGSALLQAVVKLGPAFGASILGSVLNSSYQARVDVAGLPAAVADTVRASVFGGLGVAQQLGSASLVESVRAAFVSGVDDAARLSAIVSALAVGLVLAFLPARRTASAARIRERVPSS